MKTKSKIFLAAVAMLVGVMTVSSCKKENSAGQKSLTVMLTDDPSIIFDSIFIDIRNAEIQIEKADGTESWQTLAIQPGVYNILRFRNGLDMVLGTVVLPPGSKIEKLRLTLGNQNSAMKGGVSYPLALHNNLNQFIINIDDDTDDDGDSDHKKFWLDFDGVGSIIEVSPGHFELSPSMHHFSHHNSGEVEGKVRPSAAQPVIVKAISGSDTLIAKTEDEGEFKISGIHTTSIKLIIHPSNGYKDSVMNNVQVRQGEDTKLGTITLHQ